MKTRIKKLLSGTHWVLALVILTFGCKKDNSDPFLEQTSNSYSKTIQEGRKAFEIERFEMKDNEGHSIEAELSAESGLSLVQEGSELVLSTTRKFTESDIGKILNAKATLTDNPDKKYKSSNPNTYNFKITIEDNTFNNNQKVNISYSVFSELAPKGTVVGEVKDSEGNLLSGATLSEWVAGVIENDGGVLKTVKALDGKTYADPDKNMNLKFDVSNDGISKSYEYAAQNEGKDGAIETWKDITLLNGRDKFKDGSAIFKQRTTKNYDDGNLTSTHVDTISKYINPAGTLIDKTWAEINTEIDPLEQKNGTAYPLIGQINALWQDWPAAYNLQSGDWVDKSGLGSVIIGSMSGVDINGWDLSGVMHYMQQCLERADDSYKSEAMWRSRADNKDGNPQQGDPVNPFYDEQYHNTIKSFLKYLKQYASAGAISQEQIRLSAHVAVHQGLDN